MDGKNNKQGKSPIGFERLQKEMSRGSTVTSITRPDK